MSLNDIVKVDVSIAGASPALFETSDNILIVGLPPVSGGTLPDVAKYHNLAEVAEAGYIVDGNGADPVGIAARIAFMQNPAPEQIYVAAMKEGDVNALEPVLTTLERALDNPEWSIVCPAGVLESDYEAIANFVETKGKDRFGGMQFAYTFFTGVNPVSDAYFRSHGWYGATDDAGTDIPENNRYVHVAAVAKCISYHAGTETWAFKQLNGITPSSLSDTFKKKLTNENANYIGLYAGKIITMNGKTRAGEWIDIIRGRDWIQFDMQWRMVNLMLSVDKISYTESNLALVEAQIIATLRDAQTYRIIKEDEVDDDDKIIPAFTVSVPRPRDISQQDRMARRLAGCTFTAKLDGAIHLVEISGVVTH